ncbi:hypothetical protein [Micrococcus sp.]|uniref:hypothetical protein n=1 Tax=Micrococcus sp. TaxID=1271 RepID=UPI002A91E240|nr:hypothetical protein [Micrococcus sp.]MDY6054865.1 hypothetical protein [Micrococcus sp.]
MIAASLPGRRSRRWPAPAAVRVLRLVAGALALALVLGMLMQAQAAQRLKDLVDRTWRGSYDLIVSAPGAAPSAEDLRAPLDTAAWTSAADRLTSEDLETVRGVEGVEIAAPLGDLAMTSVSNKDALYIAYPADGSVQGPHAYDVDVRVTTDDGLGERPVLGMEASVVGDFSDEQSIPDVRPFVEDTSVCVPAPPEPGPCTDVEMPTLAVGPRGESPVGTWNELPAGKYWAAPLAPPDPQGNRIVVVDAAAEAQLLALSGREQTAAAYRALAQSAPSGTLQEVIGRLDGLTTPEAQALQEAEDRLSASLEDLVLQTGRTPESITVVPLLATAVGSAPLRLDLTTHEYREPVTRILPIDAVDPSLPSQVEQQSWMPKPRWQLPAGGTQEQGVTASMDVSAQLGGLGLTTTVVPLPGPAVDTDPLQDLTGPRMHLAQEVATLSRGDAVTAGGTLTEAATVETASGTLPGGTSTPPERVIPGSTAQESAYYAVTEDRRRFGSGDAPLLVSVGTLTPEPDAALAGIAPLLTDVELPTTLVAAPDGTPQDVRLRPASTGFGLANQMPAAYVDAASAEALGLDAPFSTVRVRVAGVGEDLTPENLATIDAVAERLRREGFAVTPVVASSLSPRQMQVVSYRFPDGGDPAPLGTVEQLGPELGAAQRVSAAVGGSGLATTMTVVATLGTLAGFCLAAAVAPRRRRAALLSLQGWSSSTTAGRHLREDAPTLALLLGAAAGIGVVALQPGQAGVHPGLLGLGAAVTLALAAATVAADLVSARPARGRTRPVREPRTVRAAVGLLPLTARWTARSLPRLVMDAACRGAAALGVALLVGVVLNARRQAGASLLAEEAVAQDTAFQLGIGALAVAAGITLLIQLHRVEGPAVQAEAALLVQQGFTRGRVLLRHLVPVLASAAAGAAVVAVVLVLGVAAADVPPALAAAAAMLCLTVLTTVAIRRSQIARVWREGPLT